MNNIKTALIAFLSISFSLVMTSCNDDDDYDQDDEVIVDVENASKKNGKQIDIA